VTAVWDLLLFAKNLFVAAKIVWHEVQPSRDEREAIRQLSAAVPLSYRSRAPLMASQDTVLSVPAGSNQVLAIARSSVELPHGFIAASFDFRCMEPEMIGFHRNAVCCAGPQ
jgi:hypothetical protein